MVRILNIAVILNIQFVKYYVFISQYQLSTTINLETFENNTIELFFQYAEV
jgi:hypothetical protein